MFESAEPGDVSNISRKRESELVLLIRNNNILESKNLIKIVFTILIDWPKRFNIILRWHISESEL